MKKIKIAVLSILILISLSTNVIAISTSYTAATRTAITAATTSALIATKHQNKYSIDDVIKDVFYETQNEELKNYILENKQYLYLDDKDKTESIINKYKESNLEETKQFIKDNYYDENKPENEKKIMICVIIIIVLLILGVIMIIIA